MYDEMGVGHDGNGLDAAALLNNNSGRPLLVSGKGATQGADGHILVPLEVRLPAREKEMSQSKSENKTLRGVGQGRDAGFRRSHPGAAGGGPCCDIHITSCRNLQESFAAKTSCHAAAAPGVGQGRDAGRGRPHPGAAECGPSSSMTEIFQWRTWRQARARATASWVPLDTRASESWLSVSVQTSL